MAQTQGKRKARTRRTYSEEFKQEAVRILLDGQNGPYERARFAVREAASAAR